MIIYNRLNISKAQGLGPQAIRLAGLWILVIAFFWLEASAANASGVTDENVVSKIDAADTVEDHHALEAYFNRKAAEAIKQVHLHEDMLQSYTRRSKAEGFSITIRSHCQKLIQSSRDAQENYKHMAELHGGVASELAK
jgi:hypothetical protein